MKKNPKVPQNPQKSRLLPPLKNPLLLAHNRKLPLCNTKQAVLSLSFGQDGKDRVFALTKQTLEKYVNRLQDKGPFTDRGYIQRENAGMTQSPYVKMTQKIGEKIKQNKYGNNKGNVSPIKEYCRGSSTLREINLLPSGRKEGKKRIAAEEEKIKMLQKIYSPRISTFLKNPRVVNMSPCLKKKVSDCSFVSSLSSNEEFNVWDNTELAMKGVDINNSNPNFMNILKMRLQNFPQQNLNMNNKDVVDFARNLVGGDRINNQILENFQDQERYHERPNPRKDLNCLKFLTFYYRVRLKDKNSKIHKLFAIETKRK